MRTPAARRPGRRRALEGAVVVVSGASRGIGAATAEALGARGAQVVCVGRDAGALADVARRCGGSVVVADARDVAGAEQVVTEAVARHGRLDGVVVNAGVGHFGPVTQMDPARIAELVDVNVRGALLLARAGAAALAGPDGGDGARDVGRVRGVVLVSSIAGAVGVPQESVYSATKAALEAFAPLLREELRPSGTTVSTVLPGVVETEFFTRRGAPYDRTVPRPLPAARVAAAVVEALETGRARQVVPGWLAFPAWLSAALPGPYRALARRFS